MPQRGNEDKEDLTNKWISSYSKMFPSLQTKSNKTGNFSGWDQLTQAVYLKAQTEYFELFPVWKGQKRSVGWFPILNLEENGPHFGSTNETKIKLGLTANIKRIFLDEVLVQCNFNLVDFSFNNMIPLFKSLQVSFKETSPETVMDFLRGSSDEESICKSKGTRLPCELKSTTISNVENLEMLIEYCLKAPIKEETNQTKVFPLDNLPLLLTKDGLLRRFSKQSPVFGTYYAELVEGSEESFLSETYLEHFSKVEKVFEPFIKGFGLADLARMSVDVSNGNKIKRFWSFIKENRPEKDNDKNIVRLFGELKVFPVKTFDDCEKPLSKFWIPLNKANSAIILNESHHQKLPTVLKKIGVFIFDSQQLEQNNPNLRLSDLKGFAKKFGADLLDREGVAEALKRVIEDGELHKFDHLSEEEKLDILVHFEQEPESLSRQSLNKLKELPLFQRIDGSYVDLKNLPKIHTFPSSIPREGFSSWQKNGCIFFLEQPKLERLYKRLGFSKISDMEVYIENILPAFDNLTEEVSMIHLQYLSKLLMYPQKEEHRVLSLLKQTPIIGQRGSKRPISVFFDPRKDIFKDLVAESELLPQKYSEQVSFQFFEKIGLQKDLTEDLFVRFAKDIEEATVKSHNQVSTEKKSKILLKCLCRRDFSCQQSLLERILNIKFIPLCIVNQEMKSLLEQHNHQSSFICLQNSVAEKHRNLVWSSATLIPDWVASLVDQKFQFQSTPTFEIVMQHCKNLCSAFTSKTSEKSDKLVPVFQEIYEFLNSKLEENSNLLKEEIQDCAFIIVEKGTKLVKSNQIALNLEEELSPYLYKLPSKFCKCTGLFETVGAVRQPSPQQYSIILQSLFESSRGDELCPEEIALAQKAVKGFFNVWDKVPKTPSSVVDSQKDISATQELYLLSAENCLKKSSTLIFNDRPKFKHRLKNFDSFQKSELASGQVDNLKIGSLPDHLKPRLLGEIISEILDDDENQRCQLSSVPCKLKNRCNLLFSDNFFKEGLKRIANHYWQKKKTEKIDNIDDTIKAICEMTLECRTQLKTRLQFLNESGEQIETGSEEVEIFTDKNGTVFVSHEKTKIFRLCEEMANKIATQLRFPESNIILAILHCEQPEDIPSELDYQDILDDKSIQNPEKKRLKAGSRIEPRFHGFLLANPTLTFNEGEWVGYEMADNDCSEDSYCQTYILARIQYEVQSDLKNVEQNFTKKYLVDIGDEEPMVIRAQDLFKFCRPKTDWPLELSEDLTDIEENSDLPENFAEAQREIDQVLKNLWPLAQDQFRKISKRLYLMWHPDKNPGKEELCNEVFKYLKRKMLEIDSNVEKENIMPGQSYSNFSNFFYQWDFQARFQKEQRKERARHTQPGANVIKLYMALTYECL